MSAAAVAIFLVRDLVVVKFNSVSMDSMKKESHCWLIITANGVHGLGVEDGMKCGFIFVEKLKIMKETSGGEVTHIYPDFKKHPI